MAVSISRQSHPAPNGEEIYSAARPASQLKRHENYRPDIDGLRAIAVLAVVGFHADVGALRGGFIGVDVFFVISGYLISGIIFRALEKGTFSFAEFYVRRINRIFPALIVVLLAVALCGWLVLLAGEFANLGKHIFGGAAFLSNVLLWRETGYFQASAKPLLHLWSLAVEEQFYLAWPLVAVIAWRLKYSVGRTIGSVFAISFAVNVFLVADSHLSAAFYLPMTRFWEILAGALLIHWQRQIVTERSVKVIGGKLREALSILGLVLLGGSFVAFTSTTPWPGPAAVIPVAGTACLIGAGPSAWINRRLLSARGLVAIGLVSYPLYLWHWPLIALGKIAANGKLTAVAMAIIVVVSLLLAIATYRFVEVPIRFGSRKRRSAAIALPLMGLIAAFGLAIHYGLVGPRLNTAFAMEIAAARADGNSPGSYFINSARQVVVPVIPGPSGETVIFFGDSHGVQYQPRIDELRKLRGAASPRVLFMTFGGCPPIPDLNRRGVSWDGRAWHCDGFYRAAMERMLKPDVSTVVISAYWEAYLSTFPVYLGPGWTHQFKLETPEGRRILTRMAGDLLTLTRSGKRVYIVLPNPGAPELDPSSMLAQRIPGFGTVIDSGGISRRALERQFEPIVNRLRAVAKASNSRLINPMDFLCTLKVCPAIGSDGKPIYADAHHMRASYVRHRALFIDEVVTH